ncbi:MAG: T9SS type A sorting domain-containing protein [Vicingaceae bacterium]
MKRILLTCLSLILNLMAIAQLTADAGNDQTICQGDTAVLGGSVVAYGGFAPYNYTWLPVTNLSNSTDSTPSAWPSNNVTYQLIVQDANGRSDTDSVAVYVVPPTQVFMSPFTGMCFYDKAQTLMLGAPSGGYYGGFGMIDSTTFDPFTSGIGYHSITYYYSDTVCQTTDSATGIIYVEQNPQLSINPPTDTVCLGDSTMVITSGGTTYSWQPSVSLNFISPDTAYVIADSSISYKIIASSPQQCLDSAYFELIVENCETGLSKKIDNQTITLYPNPACNYLNLEFESSNDIQFVEIRSSNGQLIESFFRNGMPSMKFNTSHYTIGQYFVVFPEIGLSRSFIVER